MDPDVNRISPASVWSPPAALVLGQGTPGAGSVRPDVRSRQAQSSAADAWNGDECALDAQDAADLRSLCDQLQRLLHPDSSKLADILTFFDSLKANAALIEHAMLWFPDAPRFRQLTRLLVGFLPQFDRALADQTDLVSSLDAEAIRSLCHGLSVCANPTAGIVFSEDQFEKARVALQGITDTLLTRLVRLGTHDAAKSNGVVLDILNWVSRGLKSELLTPSAPIYNSFGQALELFADWLRSDHSRGFLSVQHLAKCAVQVDLMVKRQLVPLERDTQQGAANRALLAQCGKGLCCESVLDRLVAAQGAVDEVALVNLCNAIKTLLEKRVLQVDDNGLMTRLACLLGLILRISSPRLCAGSGQTLSNLSNFVRAFIELGGSVQPAFKNRLPALEKTCRHLVTVVNGADFATGHASSQALSNLISFIKRCDKALQGNGHLANGTLRRADLRQAAGILQGQLVKHGMAKFDSAEAIGGLLSGLSYLLRSGLLASSDVEQTWMICLLQKAASLKAGRWSDASRAATLPALQTLIDLDVTTLEQAQGMLAVLLTEPASTSKGYTRTDLGQAIKALGAIEEETVALAPNPLPPMESGAQPTTIMGLAAPGGRPRTIPGLTTLAPQPMPSALTTTTNAANRSASPPVKRPAEPTWQTPVKVARKTQQPASLPYLSTQSAVLKDEDKPPLDKAHAAAPDFAASSTTSISAAASGRKARPARHTSSVTAAKDKSLRSAQEWFALFAAKGKVALERLEELARSEPALVGKSDESGKNALFHAIAGGKTDAVAWLMAHECYVAPASAPRFLDEVMSQVELYSAAFGEALRHFLARQPPEVKQALRGHFAKNLPQMQGIARILMECGLFPGPVPAPLAGETNAKGRRVEADKTVSANQQTIARCQEAAERGDVQSQFMLGYYLTHGIGMAKDELAAAAWFRKAADKGHAEAQFNMGVISERGRGMDLDVGAAAAWYRKAGTQGHASAQRNLAVIHEHGIGVEKDAAAAAAWYRKAAEQGDAESQFSLGALLADGVGVARDEEAACKWSLKAAEQGHSRAQFNLGLLLLHGTDVPRDEAAAVQWLRAAADQGNRQARTVLADFHRQAPGTSGDE